MIVLYNIGIYIYLLLVYLMAPFNRKASLWIRGRKDWEEKISGEIESGNRTVWIHCASLGEFEQGRPLIEEIKEKSPGVKVVLTFFSPSGYEIRKNYEGADYVFYLPADTVRNARKFINILRPEYAVFVKYEFWNNYISCLHENNIPLYLISALFRPEQHFFRWYGSFFRNMLWKFERIFVQDWRSLDLLSEIGISKVSVTGDTRFDRVMKIRDATGSIPVIEQFRGEERLFLAGSSWKQDEEIIVQYINKYPDRMKWIFAPHETDRSNIERLERMLKVSCVRFSEYKESDVLARVLIIDSVGILSAAYRYAWIAYVGGGFGRGIHNILEPACWGIPVLFGPHFRKFREAVDLIGEKGAMTISSFGEFSVILESLLDDTRSYQTSAEKTNNYIEKNIGATKKIFKAITSRE